jgi:hypothetical protein
MLGQQAIELPAAEACEFAGFGDVPLCFPQGFNQQGPFRLIRLVAESNAQAPRRARGQETGWALPEFEREVRDLERITTGEYHGSLNHMLELADVAGPGEPGKQGQDLGARPAYRALVFVAERVMKH